MFRSPPRSVIGERNGISRRQANNVTGAIKALPTKGIRLGGVCGTSASASISVHAKKDSKRNFSIED